MVNPYHTGRIPLVNRHWGPYSRGTCPGPRPVTPVVLNQYFTFLSGPRATSPYRPRHVLFLTRYTQPPYLPPVCHGRGLVRTASEGGSRAPRPSFPEGGLYHRRRSPEEGVSTGPPTSKRPVGPRPRLSLHTEDQWGNGPEDGMSTVGDV